MHAQIYVCICVEIDVVALACYKLITFHRILACYYLIKFKHELVLFDNNMTHTHTHITRNTRCECIIKKN